MSFFSFGQSAEIDIVLNDAETRKKVEHKAEDGKKDKYFLFYDGETVSGKVNVTLKNAGKRLEHQGIKIEFIGQIELYYDRGNHHEFVSLVKDLARPGELTQSQTFDFEFTHVEKPYESYTGQNVKLRYFLRATISRRLNDVVKEMDIVVHTLSTYPELNSSIKMEDKYFLFYDGETVSGKVNVTLKNAGKRLEHQGIKIEFIGQIELYYDRGNHHEFVSLVKDLARPGELTQSQTFDFEFTHVEKPYESYTGQNVKLRYFLRATISRRLNDVVKEMDIVVHTLSTYPELNSSIKMEVGIEDCLHIEFEYNKSKYHLKDVIVGKIYFLLVRIKVKHMEIDIIKRETTGTGPNVYHENETIAKYEIMDGAPVRGESIPIRLFLAGYELTPTMRDINKKFSVRYYLNLVLIDEEERRYFKQQEITLWRKGDIVRKSMSSPAQSALSLLRAFVQVSV
ncbi:UNVERIFIED_CONTAM: hypothetical protein FKN15_055310 [Acipenser sinensis]